MAKPEDDPNIEFLRELDSQMHRNTQVRKLVMRAMTIACRTVTSEKTDRQKAIDLGRAVEEISEEILDLL